jgi:hypothetical protein
MIPKEKFNKEQQIAIAEYIFADLTDTLIKPEAEAVIKVFQEHHIPEAFVSNVSIEDVEKLIMDNTTNETRLEIYEDYTSGKL